MSSTEARALTNREDLRPHSTELPPRIDGISAIKMLRSGIELPTLLSNYRIDGVTVRRLVWPFARLALYDLHGEQNFGPGDAGKSALEILQTIPRCEAISTEPCEQSPQLTLDYDVLGGLEQRAFCLDHLPPAMERIQADLAVTGRIASFGINGHGRA